MSTRFAGIDYGAKRIGLAVSDPVGALAGPLRTLVQPGALADQAEAVVGAFVEFDIDEWVVGYPLNMDGSAGPQAQKTEQFAACLAERTRGTVHLWDERLSSVQAEQHLAQTGLTHKGKQRRRDAVAAQVMLQTFLDARRRRGKSRRLY